NNCWYAFDDNGAMRTGWIASNEHWYFMGESGVMQADAWVEDNGARYYIKGTGVMAKDYVKDGYELTEDGKAIPLAESKSVVLTDPEAIEGEVIEGNLYVDVTTAKALELKGVTVKGKLVVIGDNQTAGKLTITDSKIEAISTQTRNTEVVLSGETEVKTIVLEETAAVTPDKSFKGEVEKIEVQSTTKGEIVIEVPAQEVSTRTYASVDIQAPVESLEVKTDTQIKVNADVKNVVVTESAKDTKVEVSKGSTVGTITADAPVKIEGSGTIEKVEANVDGVEAGKDTVIKDVETGKDVEQAPEVNKPSTGGSGGSTGPTYITKTVNNENELLAALDNTSVDKIIVAGNITLTKDTSLTIPENRNVEITINDGFTLTIQAKASEKGANYSGLIINGTLKLTGNGTLKNDTSYCTVFVNEGGNFTVDGATILSHHSYHNESIKIRGKMTLNSGVIGDATGNIENSSIAVNGITVGQDGKFVMNGGTVNASWFGIATNGTESGQTITINGGEINTVGKETNIFYLPKANTVTITGGTFNGNDGGMEMRQGNLVITGGTFTTKNSSDNSAADWGSGQSGSFWSTFAFGKPNNAAYSGDLTVNISGATIKSNADAILLDTRYSSPNANNIQITISKNTISGNVKIVVDESIDTWTVDSDGAYSYTYPSQTTNEIEINNTDDQNQSDNNNSEDNQIVNNDNLDNNTEDNQVEA
ncbi:hypothetical protein DWZ33_12235, partial [Dielma fastidiosa]